MNQKKNRRPGRSAKPKASRGAKAVREYTAGGVVFRHVNDRAQILMIQDRLGRWTIPKGHVEPGESIEQTAVREVAEETGLNHLRLGEKLDKLHFFYRKEGKLIFMTTYVFLIEAAGNTDALVPEDSEGIVDAKWFDYEEALQLIEYKDTERLFRVALSKIKHKKQASVGS
ncbi:MAG TPA: NUDIX domain-containing protein [Candidatus Saccharimonadia bacterium]|nr:NUDIX domain-containing protein [Candidatus Saccharimonadia bacterium]